MSRFFILFLVSALQLFSGEFVYIVNSDGTVSALDTATFVEVTGSPFLAVPSGGMGSSVAIAVSPNQQRAYVAGWQLSDYVAVFDIELDGSLTHIAGSPFQIIGAAPFGVAVSADSSRVYVTCPGTSEVRAYDADFNFITSATTGMAAAHPIAVNPSDGSVFVAYTDTSQVAKFDSSLNLVAGPVDSSTMMGMGTPYGIAINPAGTFVYVSNASLGEVDYFDMNLIYQNSGTTDLLGPIGMAFSSDGSILYVANTGSSDVAVLDALNFTQINPPLSSLGNNCYITQINPDGTRLYATNGGLPPPPLAVYDTATYMLIANTYMGSVNQFGIAFALTGGSFPENLRGSQKKNDFGIIYEYFNLLEWASPSNFQVAGYYVYRNGQKIATLDSMTFRFEDHDRPRNIYTSYAVAAFDSGGATGSSSSITIP